MSPDESQITTGPPEYMAPCGTDQGETIYCIIDPSVTSTSSAHGSFVLEPNVEDVCLPSGTTSHSVIPCEYILPEVTTTTAEVAQATPYLPETGSDYVLPMTGFASLILFLGCVILRFGAR